MNKREITIDLRNCSQYEIIDIYNTVVNDQEEVLQKDAVMLSNGEFEIDKPFFQYSFYTKNWTLSKNPEWINLIGCTELLNIFNTNKDE